MPYRELGVIEIREVLRRFCLGDSVRAIARGTGSDRKTVAKYVAAAQATGLPRGEPGPTDAQQPLGHLARTAADGGADGREHRRHRRRIKPRSPRGWPRGCASRRSTAGCGRKA